MLELFQVGLYMIMKRFKLWLNSFFIIGNTNCMSCNDLFRKMDYGARNGDFTKFYCQSCIDDHKKGTNLILYKGKPMQLMMVKR